MQTQTHSPPGQQVSVSAPSVEQAWLEQRRLHITGSDISKILGLSQWGDALTVFADKMGLIPAQRPTMKQLRGHAMEPVIVQRYCEDTGFRVRQLDPPGFVQDDEHPWIGGTPDRLHVGQRGILEIKAPGWHLRKEWGDGPDDVPSDCFWQSHWYIGLCRADFADVACHIDSEDDIRIYSIPKDEEIYGIAFAAAEKFWQDHILTKTPPTMNMLSSETADLLARRYAKPQDTLLDSTDETDHWALQLEAARKTIAEAEVQKREAENHLKDYIGNASGIQGTWGTVTWKQAKPSRPIDWKAIAKALSPTRALIDEHTTEKPGSRRFLCNFS